MHFPVLSKYITMHGPENMMYVTIILRFLKMNDVTSHTVCYHSPL